MELRNAYLLVSLGAIWGASYLFIRVAVPVFGSWWLIGLRLLIAGLALWVYSRFTKQRLHFQNRWWHYVVLGIVNAALPFTLVAQAVSQLNAGTVATINALTPAATAVVASLWIQEKLTPAKVFGLLMGLSGVVILVGWNPLAVSRATILAALQAVAATIFCGIGAVYARVRFSSDTPLSLALGQQLGACVWQVPLAALHPPPVFSLRSSWPALACLLALALFSTSTAYLLYFRLVADIGPSKTSTVTFLVPFFSVLWGVLCLGEKLNFGIFTGMMLILGSIVLMSVSAKARLDP